MERLKAILLCVLLACVAPAMAADWYEIPAGGDYGTGTLTGYTYNATPDQTAVDDFYANWVPNFGSFLPAPWYETSDETLSGAINDPTVNIRQNMITNVTHISSDLTAGSFHLGDTYWPWNYNYYGNTYSYQEVSQDGGAVTLSSLNFGHPTDEFSLPSTMAAHATWKIRGGSLKIGTVSQLNPDTQFTVDNGGTGFIYDAGRGLTVSTISTAGSAVNNMAINIGDIRLNETMTFLHMNAGDWTISGTIEQMASASAGNMVAMLFGYDEYDRAFLEDTYCAELVIQWSQLLNMIDNGWLYIVEGSAGNGIDAANTGGGSYYATTYVPGDQDGVDGGKGTWTFDSLYANTLPGVVQVSRSNMYDMLDILDMGDGTVNVMHATPVNVPEPATLMLLGLGAVLSFRRKR